MTKRLPAGAPKMHFTSFYSSHQPNDIGKCVQGKQLIHLRPASISTWSLRPCSTSYNVPGHGASILLSSYYLPIRQMATARRLLQAWADTHTPGHTYILVRFSSAAMGRCAVRACDVNGANPQLITHNRCTFVGKWAFICTLPQRTRTLPWLDPVSRRSALVPLKRWIIFPTRQEPIS